jgi:DNA-binding transcriptional LysR family regulator
MIAGLRRQLANGDDRLPRVVCTYGLPLNARHLVLAGMGVMITFDELVSGAGGLCFRPLSPRIEMRHKILWRKVMPTRAAQALIDELQKLCR